MFQLLLQIKKITLKQRRLSLILILLNSIFLFSCGTSFSQPSPTLDSTTLKHDLDGVLSKYGLKTTGFAINVTSNNQKDNAQTAYSITNNYYSDPNYTPDSTNFLWEVSIQNGRQVLIVSPKKGSWEKPMLLYDTSRTESPMSFIRPVPSSFNGGTGKLGDKEVNSFVSGDPCSSVHPLCINMKSSNDFYYFGDENNGNKRWIYQNYQVVWFPERQ